MLVFAWEGFDRDYTNGTERILMILHLVQVVEFLTI